METIRQETAFVAGLQELSGDPSPFTARGVLRAMQAAAQERWASPDLSRKTVAIQGVGHVGYALAAELYRVNAKLIVADADPEKSARAARDFGATRITAEEIYAARVEVLAPCALGAVINSATIPQLRCEIICGAANNQLREVADGDALERLGILYVPDYAANAGGVINICCIELLGWDVSRTRRKIDAIHDTTLAIFQLAKEESIPSYRAADALAEKRLRDPVAHERTLLY